MCDVRGDFLRPSHGTTPAVVIGKKIKLRSFKSSEHITEKGDGSYRGFGYLSLFSDPIDLATWSHSKLLKFCIFYPVLLYPAKRFMSWCLNFVLFAPYTYMFSYFS